MVAGARTLSLEDTFLGPQVLNPPPTRHALLAFLVALAAVVHIGTAGWGDLYDGLEGETAAAAREMTQSRTWWLPTNDGIPLLSSPPLGYWIISLSYKIFGVSATAARIPVALATVGTVAFVFLVGERLAGYWRGFAAGLIYVCSIGGFMLARIVSPHAFAALFVAGAVYCAVCGYQSRKFRRAWFAGFTLSCALACLSAGIYILLCPVGVCVLLAMFFREARMRFQPLFHWSNLLLFAGLVGPWYVWAALHFNEFVRHGLLAAGPWSPRFFALLFASWCPVFLLVSPALVAAPRKIFRPAEFNAADALPLVWLGLGLLAILVPGERDPGAPILTLPGLALFAAAAWDRMSSALRVAGILVVFAAGLISCGLFLFAPQMVDAIINHPLPDGFGFSMRPLPEIVLTAGTVLFIAALIAIRKEREEVALLFVVSAMVPAAFCLAEGRSRLAPLFSLAETAPLLNARTAAGAQVVIESDLRSASSLTFLLDRKWFPVNQAPGPFETDVEAQRKYLDEHFVLDAWDGSSPIYLIIDQSRVAYWRRLIVDRVHIYHQVTTCGSRVVLSNQL